MSKGTEPVALPPTRERVVIDAADAGVTLKAPREQSLSRHKGIYIGAPACFALEMACKHIREAFPKQSEADHIGIYVVGSCLERPDWRDVDVRLMMDDASFLRMFPGVNLEAGTWEFDPRWCLLVVAISQWMSAQTGLPIDFQFQPMTHANNRHRGARNAIGLTFVREPAPMSLNDAKKGPP